ncbi:hypothetical protein HNR00_003051 [Methylorubrum rhodinum]|uniref:Uncharacterized protein n=1 Tax=Methylorubrum rhodinum TaxID=29428 RepID=A0A840ZN39_9HYPH|nr:hypothetical protein [Methylorubrum rhodinum]MBB5758331.1 hypothetical protein [Methylorubrum rhodinum]
MAQNNDLEQESVSKKKIFLTAVTALALLAIYYFLPLLLAWIYSPSLDSALKSEDQSRLFKKTVLSGCPERHSLKCVHSDDTALAQEHNAAINIYTKSIYKKNRDMIEYWIVSSRPAIGSLRIGIISSDLAEEFKYCSENIRNKDVANVEDGPAAAIQDRLVFVGNFNGRLTCKYIMDALEFHMKTDKNVKLISNPEIMLEYVATMSSLIETISNVNQSAGDELRKIGKIGDAVARLEKNDICSGLNDPSCRPDLSDIQRQVSSILEAKSRYPEKTNREVFEIELISILRSCIIYFYAAIAIFLLLLYQNKNSPFKALSSLLRIIFVGSR